MAETILAVFGVLIVCLLLASPVLAIMALVRSGTLRAALDRTNARLESLEARLADEPSTVSGPPRPDSTEDASEADEARSASSGWESETDPAHVGGWSLPGADSLAAPGDAAGGIERKLTSRWLVWLGGVTVALAGIFLVKYSIDQDWLGPSVRCALGVLAGVALTAAGEWCRRRFLRRATDLPEPGVIPPALGAAGIATLYSSVYAAFALYDLIGALLAFVALAVISFFSFALALLHGRFIAVLGLIGGYLVPVLVSTGEGSSLALFSFLGALVAALTVIVRYRGWWVVAWLGLAGAAAWPALWFATRWNPADAPVLGVYLVALAALFLYVRPVVGTERSFKLGLLVRQADAFLWASAVAIATLIFVLVRVDGYAPVSLAFLAVASALFLHAGYRAERYDLLGALALVPVLASFATWDIPGLLDSAGRAIGEHGWLYDLGRGPVVPPLLVPYASLSAAFAALVRACRPARGVAHSTAVGVGRGVGGGARGLAGLCGRAAGARDSPGVLGLALRLPRPGPAHHGQAVRVRHGGTGRAGPRRIVPRARPFAHRRRVSVPALRLPAADACSGFRAVRSGKRLKSRSAVQSSVTPCAMHSAATRASCTIGPFTRRFRSSSFSTDQCWRVSVSNSATGDSSQASTWSSASATVDGGS